MDRDAAVGLARTLATREEADRYFQPGRAKPHITAKQRAFARWYDDYFMGIRKFPRDSSCGPIEHVIINGARLGILPINSALFAQADDDHEELFIGRRSLDVGITALQEQETDLRIALLRHPLDWLSDIERANIKSVIHDRIDVLLTGHLHATDVESVIGVTGGTLHLTAGAAYQTRRWPNRATYATFDGTAVTVFPIRYEDTPAEVWTVDPSLFPHEKGYQKAFAVPRLAGGARPPPKGPSIIHLRLLRRTS